MRILFATPRLARVGGHIVLAALAKGLMSRGHEVTIASFKPASMSPFFNCEDLFAELKTVFVDMPDGDGDTLQARTTIDVAAAYLREHHRHYDRVIPDSWIMMAASAIAGIHGLDKTFQLVQSNPVFTPEDESKEWKARMFEMLPLIPIQRIVVGQSLGGFFQERYGNQYPVLDLFVDDCYRELPFVVQDREPLQFVASAANFNAPWKGLEFLLDSLKAFKRAPFELTLVTALPLHRTFEDCPFPVRVVSAQSPVAMRDLLLGGDVYLCTAVNESFCLALAEAITLGIPAVALDSIGNRDYARQDNCLFVEDPAEFATALETVSDLSVRRRLQTRARASMKAYTLERMVTRFEALLAPRV